MVSTSPDRTAVMLAILEKQDKVHGCYMDNTTQFVLLMLLKTGMDAGVLHLCCRKLYTNFLNMCSISILLVDVIMLVSMVFMSFLEAKHSHLCVLLAYFSAPYAVLPLPMMCLGLLDYCLEDTCFSKHSALCKCLRNMFMVLLLWALAAIYSIGSVTPEVMETENEMGFKALVCKIQESRQVTYFVVGLFSAVILILLPYTSKLPQWLKEANRLSEAREKIQEDQKSDLLFSRTETQSRECFLEGPTVEQPTLWLSLTLGFAEFWMPYLTVSVTCLMFSFGVPSYITVNLLLLQCSNSVVTGVMFWIKSKTEGPYNRLPENVCSWHLYWHLSRAQIQHLSGSVFNSSSEKRNTHFCV